MNPNSRIFPSTCRVKWLKSKLTQTVKINIDENNLSINLNAKHVNGVTHFEGTGPDPEMQHFCKTG